MSHISEVEKRINELKKNGNILSNMIPGAVSADAEVEMIETDESVVFWVPERFRIRGFYASVDREDLVEILKQVPDGVIMETLYRDPDTNSMRELMNRAGFRLYSRFVRRTNNYISNPYELPEPGKRGVLHEMYDSEFGSYAVYDDIDELMKLQSEQLNVLTDGVFTSDEWKEIVDRKQCMLYRDEGGIEVYYVYRVEGKKLYHNTSVNLGPANFLYNLERRVFEDLWDEGIRTDYWWYNAGNPRATSRWKKDVSSVVKSITYLYNDVFLKGEDR